MCEAKGKVLVLPTSMDEQETRNMRRNSFTNLLSDVLLYLYYYCLDLLRSTRHAITQVSEYPQIRELTEMASENFAEHPILGFIVLTLALGCAVPLAIVVFAAVSLAFTLLGFVFVEGVILLTGCVFMVVFLFAMVLSMYVMAALLDVLYFTILKVV